MTDERNFFDQPIINDIKSYGNIRKIAAGQGGDYTAGCLMDYPYFKKSYKLIAIDLSEQQVLDTDLRATQQINVTGNLDWVGITAIFFIYEEAKEERTVKVL